MDKKIGTTTITLSIPSDLKPFFQEISNNGYNRSFLMLKMTKILEILYKDKDKIPGGLHAACDSLLVKVRSESDVIKDS